jgi:F-type H+-transporting ATPase subunit alpha
MGSKGVKGMALNLEHDRVGIVVFGNDRDLKEGDFIVRSYSIMEIGSSMQLFGRIIDGLGNDLSDEVFKKKKLLC